MDRYNLYLMSNSRNQIVKSVGRQRDSDEESQSNDSVRKSNAIKVKSLQGNDYLILIRSEKSSSKIIFTTPCSKTGHCIRINGKNIPKHLQTFGLTTRQKLTKTIMENQAEIQTRGEQIWLKFKYLKQWQSLHLKEHVDLDTNELVQITQFFYELSNQQKIAIAYLYIGLKSAQKPCIQADENEREESEEDASDA